MSRDKILRFYRASGDEELAARLLDYADNALRSRKYRISDFLDPYGLTIAETIANHYERLRLAINGGFDGAERVKAAFIDEDFPGTIDYGLAAVGISADMRYHQLSHRDVLGALLGLGLKREKLGDIIMVPSGAQVVVDAALSDFIASNLSQIGSAPVETSSISLVDIKPREEKIKEIRATVASLRLDGVAAAGFGTSRSKMAGDIEAQKVKLNWQDAKSCAQAVKAGDTISIRGRGRVEVAEIVGQTKKGRISIVLRRYL